MQLPSSGIQEGGSGDGMFASMCGKGSAWLKSTSALASWSCCDEVPQTGQLQPQECIISQFPRPEGRGIGRADFFGRGRGSLALDDHLPILILASLYRDPCQKSPS